MVYPPDAEDIPRDLTFPEDSRGDSGDRANCSYWDSLLGGCDVCWTCYLFNLSTFKCNYYVFNFHEDQVILEDEYTVSIEKPWFFRCTWWSERK